VIRKNVSTSVFDIGSVDGCLNWRES